MEPGPQQVATSSEIESAKKQRSARRRTLTIIVNKVQTFLENVDAAEESKVKSLLNKLTTAGLALQQSDEQLEEILSRADISEQQMFDNLDLENCLERQLECQQLVCKLEKLLEVPVKSSNSVAEQSKRKFSLPSIELRQFDGRVENWLGFWGQFRKIHDDKTIDDDDKFQYLIRSTEPGTPARDLVESFPPSGANYLNAIEQLKARFAKDELIIQTYVRRLLDLVFQQRHNNMEGSDLCALYDKLNTQLRALESMGVTTKSNVAILYPLVESALPESLLRIWERSTKLPKKDYLSQLMEFLKLEVDCEEKVQLAKNSFKGTLKPREPTAACTAATQERRQPLRRVPYEQKQDDRHCIWCDKSTHSSSECIRTKSMSLDEKKEILKQKKACLICLKIGHFANKCRFYPKCLNCTKRHTYVMCPEIDQVSKQPPLPSTSKVMSNLLKGDDGVSGQDEKGENKFDMQPNVLLSHKNNNVTLLQTIMVNLVHNDTVVKVRALFDSGAQRSYIVKDVAKRLKLKPSNSESLTHSLFGGVECNLTKHNVYKCCVQDLGGKFECIVSALDKDKLCGYLPRLNDPTIFEKLTKHKITLNDTRNDCSEIGLLIGADHSGFLFTGEVVQIDFNLVAMRTKLGWVLQGVTTSACASTITQTISNLHIAELWDLETIGIKDPTQVKNSEVVEKEIMKYFIDTVTVNATGRYEVNLPWKGDKDLFNNKDLALKRLHSTTRRLLSTGNFDEYDSSLKEWLQCGIIEQVNGDDSGHYLPHHAVIKESSLTTRVRPVFDASARDFNGNSINSSLEKGINLLSLIPKLLSNFRKHEVGVSSDIKKAFLQISLSEADRKYLQFLWWANKDRQSLVTYQHCRVVFGVTCSPFLLNATIRYHLESDKIPDHLKVTANSLKESFYVDNCLTSTSVSMAECFIEQAKELMLMAQMDLRGWVVGPSKEETVVSVLGLMWNTKCDTLSVNTSSLKFDSQTVTKRVILSLAHRVFDPVGFTSPVSIVPKVILKAVHQLKLHWDEKVPETIGKTFLKWAGKLGALQQVSIPRRITCEKIEDCGLTIHAFCDASKDAYAATLFLRSEVDGKVCVRLLSAKSRVSPNKESSDISIPRLELLAAILAVRLYVQVRNDIALEHSCYFWSDSNVVLSWIRNNGNCDVFVKNRVKEILKETKVQDWHHIPGTFNPADLPSRGCDAEVLLNSRWWEGPSWLKLDMKDWPFIVDSPTITNRSCEKVMLLKTTSECFTDSLVYFSKYTKIIRMVAWMLRFCFNCRSKECRRLKSKLTIEELDRAEKIVFLGIQKEQFSDNDTYHKLAIFQDTDGLIRVKTKLFSEDIPSSYKYPILLPSKHKIVERLVIEKHNKLYHAGTQTLLANLRETLWIIGVRLLVKKVSKQCVVCQKQRASCYKTPPAPLPVTRTNVGSKPFETTGIDLAGPFILRCGKKVWLVLFTCGVYRAIHLEVVESLSTNDFLLALRRFIARRGRVRDIYSDNGTNFIGARILLKNVDWNQIEEHANLQKINWHLIAPASPWWGGWWERMIRMVKELLRCVLGQASVSLLEFQTLLYECESIINSRPLTYIRDDVDILLQPLTPATFLQPIPCSDVPDLDQLDNKAINVRVRYLQNLREDLRSRFAKEYLSLLVQQGKDHCSRFAKTGDVVLMETPQKRVMWPLGLIIEVFKGIDGIIRTARVKTAKGVYTRSLKCLYPLELELIK